MKITKYTLQTKMLSRFLYPFTINNNLLNHKSIDENKQHVIQCESRPVPTSDLIQVNLNS